MGQPKRPGNGEAWELLDNAWYQALNRLGDIIQTGDDAQATAAARVVLEYAASFTQLGPPHIPEENRPSDLDWNPND